MNENGFADMDLFEGLFDPFAEVNTQPQPRPAKVGGRFTREAVRVLRNWLATHQSHPYPRDSERRMLQEQTGLTKTQISNWLANARRRGKIPSSASSPHESGAIDIPARPGTPAVRNTSEMDPLQRWVDSPPEDEPAAVTAIARAVSSARPLSGELYESIYSSLSNTICQKWRDFPIQLNQFCQFLYQSIIVWA
ncbi:hypothetical protein NCS52_01006100 [Fusarium sp. LHS14.1]|nr:hypothetical protein NCS52_01006100 [Fusarium sp. LHS14.1]